MNREDIIRMARESGIEHLPDNWGDGWWQADSTQSLERFFHASYAAGAAAEREAIVQMIESDDSMRWAGAAEAIRARGEK